MKARLSVVWRCEGGRIERALRIRELEQLPPEARDEALGKEPEVRECGAESGGHMLLVKAGGVSTDALGLIAPERGLRFVASHVEAHEVGWAVHAINGDPVFACAVHAPLLKELVEALEKRASELSLGSRFANE